VNETLFEATLASVQERLERLVAEAGPHPQQETLLRTAVAELTKALDALDTAAEDLCQQNEELAATRVLAEQQRLRYQELFYHAPDAYVVVDRLGLIQEVNLAAAALLGRSLDSVVRKPLVVFLAGQDRRTLWSLLAGGGAVHAELGIQPLFGAPVRVFASVTEIRDEGGARVGFRLLMRDLSTTERTAQALRESEERFRAMFDHTLQAILVLDDEGRILEANPAARKLVGLDPDLLLGRALSNLLVGAPPSEDAGSLVKLRRADGVLRSVVLTSRVTIAPGQHLVFAQDVTALEAATADRDLLRALAAHRLEAREDEARRIARELHDEAGQLLTAVHLGLEEVAVAVPAAREGLAGVHGQLGEIEQRLRGLSHELRPTLLDDLGLLPALQHLAESTAARSGVAITIEPTEISRLPPGVETTLYRVAQEAVTNALRHSRARSIVIRISGHPGEVLLAVRDDGVGFDPEAARAGRRGHGVGLPGVRERMEAVGGELTLRSGPRAGTEVVVRVPL
jgi:PAS domain S-box-containing protein